jgi:hypothetical protein
VKRKFQAGDIDIWADPSFTRNEQD